MIPDGVNGVLGGDEVGVNVADVSFCAMEPTLFPLIRNNVWGHGIWRYHSKNIMTSVQIKNSNYSLNTMFVWILRNVTCL